MFIHWRYLKALVFLLGLVPLSGFGAAFTAGNLVVYRIGNGIDSLVNTGNPVFLDEYTPTGTLVQSIALPTTASGGNNQLIASGTSTSEGLLTLSADGKYLLLAGYARDIGGTGSVSSTTGTTVPRTVGRVDAAGNIDTTTALTDFATANNPRSVASDNGTNLWVAGGAGGVRYATLGATTSTQLSTTLTNLRQVSIFNGQLYISTSSGSAVRVGSVGTGLPTTAGQTISNLSGFPTSGSPYAFFFADLDTGVAGVDTLYVADDGAGALTKFSLVGANWTSNGIVGADADDYRGLTASVSGTTVTLFATRKGGSTAAGGGELVTLVDSSGYNGAFSGTPTLLVTAATNMAFRGVAFAPQGIVDTAPTVTATTPANSATNIATNSTIAVNFGENVDLTASAVTLECPVGTAKTFTGLPATNVNTVTLTPSAALPNSTTCTVTVVANEVTDKDGTADNMASNSVFSFTTAAASIGNSPTITFDTTNTSNFIDDGAVSVATNFPVTGTVGTTDTTDPMRTLGVNFTIADPDGIATTSVTATSSNQTVVPNANITITGSGTASANVKIQAAATGYSNITVTVSDGSNTAPFVINYAASAVGMATSRYHSGKADASTAIAVDTDYMLVADDEDQTIRLYNRANSGLPANSFNFTSSLGLTDLSGGIPREVDIEGSTQSGSDIYWLASHSNSSGGSLRPNRYRLIRTTVSGSGASSTVAYISHYGNLRTDLISWGDTNGYGFTASAVTGKTPEDADKAGFNIEGFTIAPDGTTAFIGFRAPQVPTSGRVKALIAPIGSFVTWANGGFTSQPTIGSPIELNLGGRGIRSIECNANGCLIIAGASDGTGNFKLYRWSGNAAETPDLLSTDLSTTAITGGGNDGSFESIVSMPTGAMNTWAGQTVQLLLDNGDTIYYSDSTIAKDLPQTNHKKFRSESITLGAVVIPPFAISSFNPTDGATAANTRSNLQVQFNRNIAFGSSGVITLYNAGGSVVETFDVATPGVTLSISGNALTINPTANLAGNAGYYLQVGSGAIQDTNGNSFAGFTDATTWNFTTAHFISQIQGAGAAAAITGTVTIEGIVTGDFQLRRQLRGFFMQEEDADSDGNPATSEGLFVFTGDTPIVDVAVGDQVRVTGTAAEFFNMTQLSTATAITVNSSSNPLPTATNIDLPIVAADLNGFYEQFEGMLVRFTDTLSISGYNGSPTRGNVARFGDLELFEGGRPLIFTQNNAPGAAGYTTHLDNLARRRVILDDDDNCQNSVLLTTSCNGQTPAADEPYFWPRPGTSTSNILRGGDTITNLTGILHWSFNGQSGNDAWRIRPVEPAFSYAFTSANSRPVTLPIVGSATLKIATFNVLNYFKTIDNGSNLSQPSGLSPRGANSADEFTRQSNKTVAAILALNADLLGINEMENNGFGANSAIQDLVNKLNAVAGAGTYAFVNPGTASVGGDAITVGFIYKPAALTIASGTTPALLTTGEFDPVNAARHRVPIAATFVMNSNGEKFTAVAVHLKSKGSLTSVSQDADQLDGQGNNNFSRTQAAIALRAWIATNPTGTVDPDYLVLGDFNAYAQEDPITNFTANGYVNLVPGYSYAFDGQIGSLDHVIANASLAAQFTAGGKYHINADELDIFDYNDGVRDNPPEAVFARKSNANLIFDGTSPFRTSDHDPVVIGLALANLAPANGICGSANGQTFSSAPSNNLCGSGTASSVSGSGPWSWSCAGANGGATANCSALPSPISGACGSANGQTFSSAPSNNLCSSGIASSVSGSGPWSWSCAGSYGGSPANCSALFSSGGGDDGGGTTDDGDTISDGIENAGPNGGDGNGDGVFDSQQNNVTSLPIAGGSGQYLTLQTPVGTRLGNVAVQTPGQVGVSGDYPWGVLSFEVFGLSPVMITLYLPGRSTVAGLALNKITGGQTQALNASFSVTPIGGQPTVMVSYSLTDNGPHDTCPASGQICDPVGVTVITDPPILPVLLTVTTTGNGTITSVPAGINCGSDCSESYNVSTLVTLTAKAGNGKTFTGWSGGGCSGAATACTVTMSAAQTVTATFSDLALPRATIGVLREGQWYLDANGNNRWDECGADGCRRFGQTGDMPTSGNWDGGDKSLIGVLRASTGQWFLDRNGNNQWDECVADHCYPFGQIGDLPVAGDWIGGGFAQIGVFRNGQWYLDANGNGKWDECDADSCASFGQIGDLPVVGDWNGDGKTEIGVFRAGSWYFDANGNGKWDGCGIDLCYPSSFGQAGDYPIAGDWTGDGIVKIGVFRAGSWYFDNGNRTWNGCAVDLCFPGSFGRQGDLPIIGRW